jgi:hypothetical protein
MRACLRSKAPKPAHYTRPIRVKHVIMAWGILCAVVTAGVARAESYADTVDTFKQAGESREFFKALRGGWSVRQIGSQFGAHRGRIPSGRIDRWLRTSTRHSPPP